MPKVYNIYEEVLNASGGTTTIDLADIYDRYVFTGSGSLTGPISITTTGSAQLGMVLDIQYDCTFTAGGASVTILGTSLDATLIGKSFKVEAYYNGSTWDLNLILDFYNSQIIKNTHIVDATITGAKLVNSTVTLDKLETDANVQTMVLEISMESGEQANNTIEMQNDFSIDSIYVEVIKAFAATDAGTIVPKINGTNITLNTPISIPASTAINTTYNHTCSSGNTGTSGDILSFVAAKTTAGGKARITVKWTKV